MSKRVLIYEDGGQKAVDNSKFIKDSSIHTINAEKCTFENIVNISEEDAERYLFFYMTTVECQGMWYYNPSDTISADNKGTIRVTNWGGRFYRYFEDNIYAEWFGAKGDGITDNYEPISKAIEFIRQYNPIDTEGWGNVVYNKPTLKFKIGRYDVSQGFLIDFDGFSIKEAGKNNTTINLLNHVANDSDLFRLGVFSSVVTDVFVNSSHASSFRAEDISFKIQFSRCRFAW